MSWPGSILREKGNAAGLKRGIVPVALILGFEEIVLKAQLQPKVGKAWQTMVHGQHLHKRLIRGDALWKVALPPSMRRPYVHWLPGQRG